MHILALFVIALVIAIPHTSEAVKPDEQITITYKIDISSKATGLSAEYLYDEITIPTVQGKNTYTTTVTYNKDTTIEKISREYLIPYDSVTENNSGNRTLLQFAGWRIGNSSTIITSGQNLTYEQLSKYASNGKINLTTTWKKNFQNYQYVNFYINYKSEALDSEGDVSDDRGAEYFTPSLWASYVGNANKYSKDIVGSTKDNSFQVNKEIRALYKDKGNKSIYLESFPSDEYILEKLKTYANVLSIDGQLINKDELDLEHYSIRWYVFKLQDNGWHIDGKLVRNEGKMIVTKTFTNIDHIPDNFYINLKGGNTNKNLYINESECIASTKNSSTYRWIVDIKYGINYKLTEQNYIMDNYLTKTTYKIIDPDNLQTTETLSADVADVIGINNYAIDSTDCMDMSKILSVNFTNTYISTASINPMPMTGGNGTNSFYNLGILLIGYSTIMFYFLKKGKQK